MIWLIVLLLAVLFAVLPRALALVIDRARPQWPRRRKVILAALPLPLLVAMVSVVMLGRGQLFTSGPCQTDRCGFALTFGAGGMLLAAMLMVMGFAAASATLSKRAL